MTSKIVYSLNIYDKVLIAAFLIVGLLGTLSPLKPNLINVDFIFEIVVMGFAGVSILRGALNKQWLLVTLAFATYLLLSFWYAYANGSHPLDFAQAYKSIYYIILFSFVARNNINSENAIAILFKILILLFSIKYTYSAILGLSPRMSERPAIFVENNYELVFIIGLYFLSYRILKVRERPLYYAALLFIVFISGSRSAALGLVAASIVYFATRDVRNTLKFAIPIILALGSLLLVFWARGDMSLSEIDRFRFFTRFINELSSHGIHSVFFGTPRITELSASTCTSLSYYQLLFSYDNSNSCYSVIFHSYFMRSIFDHGLLITIGVISTYFYAVRQNLGDTRLALSIVAIICCSSLSVSGFGDYFSILLLIIASTMKVNRPNASPSPIVK